MTTVKQKPEDDAPADAAPKAAAAGAGTPENSAAASEAEGETVIELPEIVDLPRAGDLYEQLAGCDGHPLRIDAGRVTFIGTPALQVLLAAALAWRRGETAFALVAPSAGFIACSTRVGIDPALFTQGTPA